MHVPYPSNLQDPHANHWHGACLRPSALRTKPPPGRNDILTMVHIMYQEPGPALPQTLAAPRPQSTVRPYLSGAISTQLP